MYKILIETKLKEIDQIIKNEYQNEENIGVLVGLSGMALFQFYYSKYLDINDHADVGVDIITHCIGKINEGYNTPTYCRGIAGFGWVLDHLDLEGFMDADSDELLQEIDHYLYSAMIADLKEGNYDFLHGAIGYLFYFLNRFRNTKSNTLKDKYKEIIFEFILLLENLSEKEGGKIKWLSNLTYEATEKGYNLCLSHGMSSIVKILTKLYQENDFKQHVETLLKGAIRYITSFKDNDNDAFCLFPNWILQNGEPEGQSRLAWCYGDLGIGIALWYASKTLKDENLENESLQILKHAAKRKTSKSSMVKDAGICHGAFGNAKIFNRLYKETKDNIFKEASIFWMNKGIEMATFDDGYSGYKMWNPDNEEWSKSTSLLDGIVGIGLTMIDHLANFDSNWDESLMIS